MFGVLHIRDGLQASPALFVLLPLRERGAEAGRGAEGPHLRCVCRRLQQDPRGHPRRTRRLDKNDGCAVARRAETRRSEPRRRPLGAPSANRHLAQTRDQLVSNRRRARRLTPSRLGAVLLERFPPKWLPVRRKKTRQIKNQERDPMYWHRIAL